MLEAVFQKVREAVRHHLLQFAVHVQRGGIGWLGIGEGVHQRTEGLVQAVLAHEVAQAVEDDTALVVVDVSLVLHLQQGHLLQFLAPARALVPIALQLQELPHGRAAVLLFHHHERAVLRHALAQQGGALHFGTHHLVRPPLVPHLVRHHVEHHVDVGGVAQVGDEADAFAVRHGAGEGLREGLVAGELDDARLLVPVRAEVGVVVAQRLVDAVGHARHVLGVRRVVVHLHIHLVRRVSGIGPLLPQHLVARAHERVEIHAGVVHDVLEVALAILGPFPLERTGGDGDLVRCGADHGAHVYPVAVRHQVLLHARGAVRREAWHPILRWQFMLAPVVLVLQLATFAVPDRGDQVHIIEEGAVVVQFHHGHAVLKALRHMVGAHGEVQLFARHQGLGELVDPVVHALVVEDERGAGDLRLLHDTLAAHVQVERVDGHGALVAHGDPGHAVQDAFVWFQVDGEVDVGVVRLHDALVLLVGLLVVHGVLLTLIAAHHVVEHLGVVIGPSAEADPCDERRQDDPFVVGEALAREPHAPGPSGLLAADPEEEGHGHQHRAEGRPVALEPGPCHLGRAISIHVRVHGARRGVEVGQVGAHVQCVQQEAAAHHHHDEDRVTHVLVVHQDMDHEGEREQDAHAHQVRQDVIAQVHARFQSGVALDQLEDHAAERGDQQHETEQHQQRRVLAEQSDAQGDRGGVMHLVQLRLAFLPHQQPAVEGDQDHDEETEGTLRQFVHTIGDRMQGVLVERGRESKAQEHVEQADARDKQEGRALQHAGEVVPHDAAPLAEARSTIEPAVYGWNGDARHRRSVVGGGRHLRRGLLPAIGETETPVANDEDDGRQSQPEQPVPEENTVHGQQHRVLVVHAPVARDQFEGRATERIEQGGQRPVVHLGHEALGHAAAHQDHNGRDEGRGGTAHKHGHGEDHGGGEEDVRNAQVQVCLRMRRQVVRADAFSIHPRHHAAQDHTQRYPQQGQRGNEGAAEESAQQVLPLLQGRAEHDLLGVVRKIADGARVDESGDHEQAERTETRVVLEHHVGRVQLHVGQLPAHHQLVPTHQAEAQQREQQEEDVHHRLPEPVAQFDEEEAPGHAATVLCAPLMWPKKTSSNDGSTPMNPLPGSASL